MKTRNLLKAYGEQDRRGRVRAILSAIFGDCLPDPPSFPEDAQTAESLLAAVRFDWPGEPPVGWVEELSRRMPDETFELYSDPAPAEWGSGCRTIIRGGRHLDGVGSGNTGWLKRNLPLPEPALAAEGPLDLVAITIAVMDRFYDQVWDDIVYPLDWKTRIDMNLLGSQAYSLEAILTPDEALNVTPRRELHKERTGSFAAFQRASDVLERAFHELSSPYVTRCLDKADRLAIERMRLLSENLRKQKHPTASANTAGSAIASAECGDGSTLLPAHHAAARQHLLPADPYAVRAN